MEFIKLLLHFENMEKNNKKRPITKYILQGGVQWYANCGFPFRSSVSCGQERSPKSAPTTCTNRCASYKKSHRTLGTFGFADTQAKP